MANPGGESNDAVRLMSERREFVTRIGVAVGMMSFVFASIILLPGYPFDRPARVDPVAQQLAEHSTQISAVGTELRRLRGEVQALASSPDRTSMGASVARLDTVLAQVQARQARLEGAIMADPARALQVPLLHRDVEALRIAQVQQVEGLRNEIDRLYDVTKWLIGGLASAVLVMVVAFGRGEMRRRREPEAAAPAPGV